MTSEARRVLVVLLLAAAAVRLPLLPINEAEYTDGILQLIQFRQPTGIWPPLYTALCAALEPLLGELWAGRSISTLFSILGLVPLYLIAQRVFGGRAALFAGMLYIVAPTVLRWSPRVMTEATFCFLFWASCERLLALVESDERGKAARAMAAGCVAGALAAMTRYQGMLLAPMFGAAALWLAWRGRLSWSALACLVLFAGAPAWMAYEGSIHGEQFAERSVGQKDTLKILLLNLEPFLLLTPYFLTYPVAFLVLLGLFRGEEKPPRCLLLVTMIAGIALLVAQSLFSSFQERYLLPWYGLLLVYAGAGLAEATQWARSRHPRLAPYPAILTVGASAAVSVAVLLGTREAFGELRRATDAAVSATGPDSRVWTNEIYRARGTSVIAADKVRFFAPGREVRFLGPVLEGREAMSRGDVIVLSATYGGTEVLEILSRRHVLSQVGAPHVAVLVPLFPDIMETPGTAQNPIAWNFRYTRQRFEATVYRVEGVR